MALVVGMMLVGSFSLSCAQEAAIGDPSGTDTGTIKDVPAKEVGQATLTELGDAVGHNRVAINMTWTLSTGYLVMFMAAGFALVAAGFMRAKNVANTVSMVFMVYAIGTLGFWLMGFAIMFGGLGPIATMGGTAVLDHEVTLTLFNKPFGLFGLKGFFLHGLTYDVAVFSLFLFQKVFMDTANYIPTGAMAERWKFLSFVFYSLFMSTLLYPLFGNWVWGGGWLSQLGVNFGLGHGHVDFAGSSVVHMVGGVCALAGAIASVLGLASIRTTGDPCPCRAIIFPWRSLVPSFWPSGGLGLILAAPWQRPISALASSPRIPCWHLPRAR